MVRQDVHAVNAAVLARPGSLSPDVPDVLSVRTVVADDWDLLIVDEDAAVLAHGHGADRSEDVLIRPVYSPDAQLLDDLDVVTPLGWVVRPDDHRVLGDGGRSTEARN